MTGGEGVVSQALQKLLDEYRPGHALPGAAYKDPGIYELEWGATVGEVLALCGAEDTMAVQVGGPSGACVSPAQFDRLVCYSDLGTGGAFTIFSNERDLLSIVHNHMTFFVNESCGFCVPCRAGTTLLL